MASLSALVGASLAWLLVLVLSTGAGVAVVVAWTRWGTTLGLPAGVRAAMNHILGAPQPAAAAADADPSESHTRAPPPARAKQETQAEAPSLTVSPGGAATATEMAAQEPDQPEAPGPTTVETKAPAIPRAEAIEELSGIFGLSYEESVALYEGGLMGLGNHEEWTRSVRQGSPPVGIPENAVQKVLARSSAEIAPELEAFRAKRGALRELESLWGVGPEQAEKLFAAGFDGREAIRRATTEKLSRVEGIGRALAFQIRAAAHDLAPTP